MLLRPVELERTVFGQSGGLEGGEFQGIAFVDQLEGPGIRCYGFPARQMKEQGQNQTAGVKGAVSLGGPVWACYQRTAGTSGVAGTKV